MKKDYNMGMEQDLEQQETNSKKPNISDVANMYNFEGAVQVIQIIRETVANAIQPIMENYSSIQSMMKDYYSVISTVSHQLSVMQEVYKPILSRMSSILSSIDFSGLQEALDENSRKKIAYCLKFDIYPPLLFLDEVILYTTFDSQLDADEFLKEHLRYWEEENNKLVYDFVPLSLRTFHEMNQLKKLEDFGMYKLMVIYCCERIEFILSELQIRQQKRKIANLETSQNSFRNFLDTSNDDNEFLQNLIAEISYISEDHEKGYKEINLFKKFKDIEDMYEDGTLPLNRNLFLHGLVKESDVNYLMVQKAILAYAFFEQLFVLKLRKRKDIIISNNKRKGISRIKKKSHRKLKWILSQDFEVRKSERIKTTNRQ
ncbi:hypothetical protein [Streptococcus gallolyticus]|uniref:hypothetical protein n=1 Tax=Streptococcus gallolyticus TaxID=315405 RepID=UPI000B0A74EA|nr:hypothetical protein [Streptococcus gallolyticus]